LLLPADYEAIDARPRILEPATTLQPQLRLVDLEHARMKFTMLPQLSTPPMAMGRLARGPVVQPRPAFNASSWWQLAPADALLTGLIQQQQAFRAETGKNEVTLALLPDENDEQALLHRVLEIKTGRRAEKLYVEVDRAEHTALSDSLAQGERIQPWGVIDYISELTDLAEALGMSVRTCAERFGTVTVKDYEEGWQSHPVLGFARRRPAKA
jgi:CRISPR-associated endonuclease/helicase Cas3